MKLNEFPSFKQSNLIDSGLVCLRILAKYHGKAFSMKYLQDKFHNIDERNSLKGIVDACEQLGLKNLPIKISFQDLAEKIPMPCIINWSSSYFVVIYKIENNIVYLSDPQLGLVQYGKEEFIYSWTNNDGKGVVLVIETTDDFYKSNEAVSKNRIKKSRKLLFIALTLLIALLAYRQFLTDFSIFQIVYSLLSFTGLLTSLLILQESLGVNNGLASKVCGNSEMDVNECQKVILDKSSFIYKNYTLGDLSLIFFTTIFFLSVFSTINLSYFIIVSLFSIPIIAYTFFYQMFKIKQWCRLCLLVSFTLVCIITNTMFAFISFNIFELLNPTIFFILSLFFFSIIWISLRPFIYGYFKFKKKIKKDKNFKKNYVVFSSLINSTTEIDSNSLENLTKIEIGEVNAKSELTLFLSPKCVHCYKVFKEAFKLYEKNKGRIKLSIYLNVNLNNENNTHRIIAKIFMQTYINDGGEIALNLLKRWFIDETDLEAFVKEYNVQINEEAINSIKSHYNWCNENGFDYSPVKLFNRKVLPDEYQIKKLKYII
ncbi:cysteine peptidase family C39 domain-containing protein [Chryseobacterium muglaense]|uniref:Thioredoxin domain-containing protein n=1 Tax=Chryseobacterium muglaense TaxID=2893752 RepID=A0ABR8MAZ1_9FLAO|nr:cysteine peptidase family C39 domain-containing protein [Chryseobacterium muglaense]MBD3907106.1 thioredoxin domain-containing protein [Chryseobacterium muglaense]